MTKSTRWILDRVKAMLAAHPNFKKDAIDQQVGIIEGLVTVVDDARGSYGTWRGYVARTATRWVVADVNGEVFPVDFASQREALTDAVGLATDVWTLHPQWLP